MVSTVASNRIPETELNDAATEAIYEKWVHWPVNWSAIVVGGLSSLAALLIFGLIGVSLGAHGIDPDHRWVDLKKLSLAALVCSVASAFFSFVIGGWVAGKVAGILRSEPGMLHGAIVWLATLPTMLLLAGLGAGALWGGWHAGLSGTPGWAAAPVAPFDKPEPLGSTATSDEQARYNAALNEYRENVKQWKADNPKVARNAALGAVTALLLGLVGAVLGGWLASGEPMNFTHFRTRKHSKQMA